MRKRTTRRDELDEAEADEFLAAVRGTGLTPILTPTDAAELRARLSLHIDVDGTGIDFTNDGVRVNREPWMNDAQWQSLRSELESLWAGYWAGFTAGRDIERRRADA